LSAAGINQHLSAAPQFTELTLEQRLVLINAPVKTPSRESQADHQQAEEQQAQGKWVKPVSHQEVVAAMLQRRHTCDSRDVGGDKASLQMRK
jgi:hypothetical protein